MMHRHFLAPFAAVARSLTRTRLHVAALAVAATIAVPAIGSSFTAGTYQYCSTPGVCSTVYALLQPTTNYLLSAFVPIDATGTPLGTQTNKFQTTQTFVSAGAQQNALAVSGVTQLTVPAGALCALITIEGAAVRRTSDGTTPSASNGSLIGQNAQWEDCGPLAAYKFYAAYGSPSIDAEYFQ